MKSNTPSPETRRIVVPEMYEAAALTMLRAPNLMARIVEDIEAVGVTGERSLALTIYLIGTSRLAKRPLAGIVQGSSASGKSHTIESVAKLFPDEAVVHAQRRRHLFTSSPRRAIKRFRSTTCDEPLAAPRHGASPRRAW